MATLDSLIPIRSQFALGLEAYLQAFVDLSRWPTPPFLGGRGVLDVYLLPDVQRQASGADADGPHRGAVSPEDEERDTSARHADERRRQPWVRGRRRVHLVGQNLVIVLGGAGEGKTLLSQLASRTVAKLSLRALRRRRVPASEIPLPVWIDAKDVEAAGSLEAAVEAVTRSVTEPDGRPSAVTSHILRTWQRPSTHLCVDSLDESEGMDLGALLRALASLTCRTLVTSRPYAYNRVRRDFPDVPVFDLAPLSRDQQRMFVGERWFAADEAGAACVQALLDTNPQLRESATNGLLLTLICGVAESHPTEDLAGLRRAQLYDLVVRDLVSRPQLKPGPVTGARPTARIDPMDAQVDLVSSEDRLLALRHAAWALVREPPFRTIFTHGDWRLALLKACRIYGLNRALVTPLTSHLKSAGLLVPARTGAWRFLHRTFLEACAAAGLAQQPDTGAIVKSLARHVDHEGWRQVALLAIGHLSLVQHQPERTGAVVQAMLDRAPGEAGRAAALMGEALIDALPSPVTDHAWKVVVGPALDRGKVAGALLTTMRGEVRRGRRVVRAAAKTRVEAGTTLGRLGDPRFRADAWFLPDEPLLGFVKVPGGLFTMGSDKRRDPDAPAGEMFSEGRSHPVELPTFYIARYPVTVAQFRAFVEDVDGNEGFHSSRDCLRGIANHPVGDVWVSEAKAYCAWLTRKLQAWPWTPAPLADVLHRTRSPWCVTLPSEAEWEKAARGGTRRRYPWGDRRDPNRAVYRPLFGTFAVGCLPNGASPYGVEDLCWNVVEWTRSRYQDYPYDPDYTGRGREHTGFPMTRGGRFEGCASRSPGTPDDPYEELGFRVAVSPLADDP